MATVKQLEERLEDAYAALCILEARIPSKAKVKAPGRKEQVLAMLLDGSHLTIDNIAKTIGVKSKNISSQLCYLRKDGYAIGTDSLGRKFLESTESAS